MDTRFTTLVHLWGWAPPSEPPAGVTECVHSFFVFLFEIFNRILPIVFIFLQFTNDIGLIYLEQRPRGCFAFESGRIELPIFDDIV